MSVFFRAVVLFAIAGGAGAQDPEHGRALYETHCGQCHAERMHERRASKVHDLDELRDQVSLWAAQTRRAWSRQEVEDVVQHLNATHYRFAPRSRAAAQ